MSVDLPLGNRVPPGHGRGVVVEAGGLAQLAKGLAAAGLFLFLVYTALG